MLTITLRWWMLWPLALFLAPCIYAYFREPGDEHDPGTDVIVWFGSCWGTMAGLIIGRWL